MLKIKDGVDLKELEKYGFYRTSRGNYAKDFWGLEIFIYAKDRILKYRGFGGFDDYVIINNCLYDFMTSNLIEKVED